MTNDKKVALITGSSRGIGAELAMRLAADGCKVVVNYAGSAGPAQGVADKIKTAGGEAIVAQADVADLSAVIAMFDAAEEAFGGVDVVVNCADILKLAKIAEFDAFVLCDQHLLQPQVSIEALYALASDSRNGSGIPILRGEARQLRFGARAVTEHPRLM